MLIVGDSDTIFIPIVITALSTSCPSPLSLSCGFAVIRKTYILQNVVFFFGNPPLPFHEKNTAEWSILCAIFAKFEAAIKVQNHKLLFRLKKTFLIN